MQRLYRLPVRAFLLNHATHDGIKHCGKVTYTKSCTTPLAVVVALHGLSRDVTKKTRRGTATPSHRLARPLIARAVAPPGSLGRHCRLLPYHETWPNMITLNNTQSLTGRSTALVVVRLPGMLVEPVVLPGLFVEVRSPPFAAATTTATATVDHKFPSRGLELQSGLLGPGFGSSDSRHDAIQSFLALCQQFVVPALPLGWPDARVAEGLRV